MFLSTLFKRRGSVIGSRFARFFGATGNEGIALHVGPKQPVRKKGAPEPPKPHKHRQPRVKASERWAEFDREFEERLQHCEQEQKDSGLPWRIDVSVYIERPPTLTDELEDWEIEYEKVQEERSEAYEHVLPEGLFGLQSDYAEIEEQALKIVQERKELRDAGKPEEKYDFQGRYASELENLVAYHEFEWPSRITKADEENDRRSTDRRGDQILYLIVQSKDQTWNFAKGRVSQKDGSVRAAAERQVLAKFGPEFDVCFPGNAPMGFYYYPLKGATGKQKQKHYGVKEFMMRSIYVGGDMKLDFSVLEKGKKSQLIDYAWVAADELEEYFDTERCKYLDQLLL